MRAIGQRLHLPQTLTMLAYAHGKAGQPGEGLVRLAEAAEAAGILGVHVRETLELANRRLFDSHEARIALATVFRRYRPT